MNKGKKAVEQSLIFYPAPEFGRAAARSIERGSRRGKGDRQFVFGIGEVFEDAFEVYDLTAVDSEKSRRIDEALHLRQRITQEVLCAAGIN